MKNEKMSRALKKCWQVPEYRKKALAPLVERNRSLKHRKAVSKGMKKQWQDPILRKKRLGGFQKRWADLREHEVQSQMLKQLHQDAEFHEKVMEALAEQWEEPERRSKQAELMRGKNADPEFQKRVRLAQNRHPNKPELLLIDFFWKYDLPFKYTGDGRSEVVGTKIPDFIHADGKRQIIEFNGGYWHTKPGARENDLQKLRIYHKAGYRVLTLWSYHLEDERKLLKKIKRFEKIGERR